MAQKPILTSETSPLRVDLLNREATRLRGTLGMTFAPGKTALGVAANWVRNLDLDLARLRDVYGTSVLVPLLDRAELNALGIANLGVKAAEFGLRVIELSIPDGGVPRSHAALAKLVKQIRATCSDGRNVVVFCRGGLGRTGLVVAACLLAQGSSTEEALRAVRKARPGTVENDRQELFLVGHEKWLRTRADASEQQRVEAQAALRSRFVGCLLGGALGDALGYPVEFTNTGLAITRRWGEKPPSALAYSKPAPALISDDTQMTLFAAEGIIRSCQRGIDRGGCHPASVIRLALVRWYQTQVNDPSLQLIGDPGWLFSERRLHATRAPGNTNLTALKEQIKTYALPTVKSPPNNSKGCGAIMRSAPFGLAASSRKNAFDLAKETGAITHGHPSGYLSAAYFASLVHDLARNRTLEQAMRAADNRLKREQGAEETIAAVANARALAAQGVPKPDGLESLGGGWVGEEALSIALVCVLTADSSTPQGFSEALWRSVVHGGDSDSTGSLTGNLLGAMHGETALPNAWLAELELADVTRRIAVDLHTAAAVGDALDSEDYPPN